MLYRWTRGWMGRHKRQWRWLSEKARLKSVKICRKWTDRDVRTTQRSSAPYAEQTITTTESIKGRAQWNCMAVQSLTLTQSRKLAQITTELELWPRVLTTWCSSNIVCLRPWLQRTWLNCTCLPITASASRRGGLRSATTSNLVIPRCRLSTYGTRAFNVAGPVCWNSLPDYLKSSDLSFNCFRQQLKTF